MLAMINSAALTGLQGYGVTVEVDVGVGLSAFDIVGLPDTSVRESRERVRAALKNSGFEFPLRRITVNLAPAAIKKEGPSLDLPIAVGILAATGQIPDGELLAASAFLGTLSLEGSIQPVSGILPLADYLAGQEKIHNLFLACENAEEAGIVAGNEVFGVRNLRDLVQVLMGQLHLPPTRTSAEDIFALRQEEDTLDMADVRGQQAVKRALEIAAAGGHNVLMIGPPGSGKTMLARRLPSIMPKLSFAESIEVTKIYSVGGQLAGGQSLITRRPFRAPHHSASPSSIIGGGSRPVPGEVSYACHGVLFLDELPEFNRLVLESLRQPLEDRIVTVARVNGRADFPASLQLVAAMNPCPCGYFGDSLKQCSCTLYQRERYFSRISGPLLDRIDMHINTPRVEYHQLAEANKEESSAAIRSRVEQARSRQAARFAGSNGSGNAAMSRADVEKHCKLEPDAKLLLQEAFARLKMSARAHDRILKMARTIADLADSDSIGIAHLAEAIQYRSLDREEQV